MRNDICYRENDTKVGKHPCNDEMLQELDVLEPKGIREKIIGTKRKLGWGIEWSNELQKPIRKKFKKSKSVS